MAHEQETFDCVVEHLRDMKRREVKAMTPPIPKDPAGSNECMYRAPNGEVCAAGRLIPDADYLPVMERKVVGLSIEAQAVLTKYGHDIALVASLQQVHDRYVHSAWESKLALTAMKYGLKYTPEQ